LVYATGKARVVSERMKYYNERRRLSALRNQA